MPKTSITIAYDCYVEVDRCGMVSVGDNMSMSIGLDAPAKLRTPEDAHKLIVVLEALIAYWPKKESE